MHLWARKLPGFLMMQCMRDNPDRLPVIPNMSIMTLLHASDKAYTTQNATNAYEKPSCSPDTKTSGWDADFLSEHTRDQLFIS